MFMSMDLFIFFYQFRCFANDSFSLTKQKTFFFVDFIEKRANKKKIKFLTAASSVYKNGDYFIFSAFIFAHRLDFY